jgi:hypothetical protein
MNVPWIVANGEKVLTATKTGGNIRWTPTYGGAGCGLIGGSPWEWKRFTITPTGNPITSLAFEGLGTEGSVETGSFQPVGTKTLGLK